MLRKLTLTFIVAGLLVTGAEPHPWATFRPGSYAKYRVVSQTRDVPMRSEMTQTLVSIDAENATVETAVAVNGQETKNTNKVPLATDSSGPSGEDARFSPWTEKTITAAGKSLACKCRDFKFDDGKGSVHVITSCLNSQIPGSLVLSLMRVSGAVTMDVRTELVEFAAK